MTKIKYTTHFIGIESNSSKEVLETMKRLCKKHKTIRIKEICLAGDKWECDPTTFEPTNQVYEKHMVLMEYK